MSACVVLLASYSEAARTLFAGLEHVPEQPPGQRVVVQCVEPALNALARGAKQLAAVDVAAVDLSPDTAAAIGFCHELRRRRTSLSVAGLLCCPHAATVWDLQALAAAGVRSLLDLQATALELVRALRGLARGDTVLHARLAPLPSRRLGSNGGEHDSLSAREQHVLALVAQGYTDREIGARLHLSPHTIDHRVEHLRERLHMRNRTQLAGWAGRHGFFEEDGGERGAAEDGTA